MESIPQAKLRSSPKELYEESIFTKEESGLLQIISLFNTSIVVLIDRWLLTQLVQHPINNLQQEMPLLIFQSRVV